MPPLPTPPAVVPPNPPADAPAANQAAPPPPLTQQTLPTPQEFQARDLNTSLVPLVELARQAVRDRDWEVARKCGAMLLVAARRGAQERTMAQVTLLCEGLRRDPPDALVEQYLAGLDAPGAFAVDVASGSAPKASPPNPADHDEIWKAVQQFYGPEYRKAQTDQQKKAFAEGMLSAARSTTDPKDPAARFVLLEWVSQVAAEAHDGALGGEAIEARAADFLGVDVLAEQWQLYEALSSASKDPLEQRRLARQLLSFASAAVDEERLELAQKFLGEAKRVAQRAKDKGLTADVQQTDKLLEVIASQRQLAQAAIQELERDPLSATANAQVGRFYCLVLGQWTRGLPWLALGSDPRLQDLAVQELGLRVDPTQPPPPVALRRKLADDWSAVAAAETDRARGLALGRAYHWYREVLRDVAGPDKNIISNLLRDMQQTGDLILSAPDDAKPYCGHYYKAYSVPLTWHLASRECEELGGHLARVESLSENRFLCQLVGGSRVAFAVRVHMTGTPPGRPVFVLADNPPDGATIDPQTGMFTWTPAEKHGPGRYQFRVRVKLEEAAEVSAESEFRIDVVEVNSPLSIRPIDNKEVEAGQELSFPIATEDTDEPVSPREFHLLDGPTWISVDSASGVVHCTPPKSVDGRFEVTIRVCDNGDPPLETQAKFGVVVHGDPWLHLKGELRKSLYLIHLQLSGPSGDYTWPFATCSAIGGRTLLTSAREVLQLASFRDRGYRIWAVNPATGLKTEIRSLRVTREFAEVADAPNDWIFVNLGLLETEQELPNSIPLATPEELASLEAGLPVACIGYPHDGSKMTRFDNFEPHAAKGEVYLMSSLTCQNKLVRLVELKGKIPDNVFGSPVVNQRGAIVAVYGESAARHAASVPDLHYAPVPDLESLQAWLRGIDDGQWVTPPMTETIAPSREQPLDRPKRP
ncbi:MAG: hypothetical protein ACYC0X_17585 [Pirellulaceae bacterium]